MTGQKPDEEVISFCDVANAYSDYRPGYPADLIDDISTECPTRDLAVDLGTGGGQLAVDLSKRFRQVIGVDVSPEQIEKAKQAANLKYVVGKAEELPFLQNESVDLITAATSFHWFDEAKFWQEAKRVLKPGGIVSIVNIDTPDIKEYPGVFSDSINRSLSPSIPKVKQDPSKIYEDTSICPEGFERLVTPKDYVQSTESNVAHLLGWVTTTSGYPRALNSGIDPKAILGKDLSEAGIKEGDVFTFEAPLKVFIFRKIG